MLDLYLLFARIQELGLRLLGAAVVLFVGLKLAKYAKKLLERFLDKSNIDPTLKPFLLSMADIALKILVGVTTVTQAGIEVTSFVAILGGASIAIGMAFQGALGNLAGGFLLLTLRHFRVGDFIEVGSLMGRVEAINIFTTRLVTIDNRMITIPNGKLIDNNITNYTAKELRRLDLDYLIDYGEDIDNVKSVIRREIEKSEFPLSDPEPFVRMTKMDDYGMIITLRIWVKSENYWPLRFELLENIKNALDRENIKVPYPQLEVHTNKDK